ncbi:ATP-binding protein [Geodermatophilus arenarius]|uniref:ATP-binding protein n=1 Tax=Geodermatophilus arenarius TaxID=1137990 RepID=A0ABV9LM92_9ACTN
MAAPAGTPGMPRTIATPDQRLRVFVSSTLEELAAERRAVRDAVARLRLTPVMFELGARPHPPRDLYRAYLAQSDVFVGVYGDRYGWVGPDMAVSGLEDELELSGGMPRLLYVRTPAPGRDPRLARLLERVQAEGGVSTTPYRDPAELGELVADDLAVLLSERFTRSVPAPPGLAAGWLPTPPTPMVDRTAELATVTGLLGDPAVRLVVLTGPGGIGKTRLALAAAAAVEPGRDGVWFVDLSGVRDRADVPAAVAEAVGVSAEGSRPLLDQVADRLAGRRALLVVDNLEQVAGAAPDLAALLARCPLTQLLVTSRAVLRLRGEHDVPIEPLRTPAADDDPGSAPAVELFVARARQADPSFALTAATAGPVAELVRRLDGLPLAVELAAARVRTLPPRLLLARLDRALDLGDPDVDVPDRQRTLRSTIAWSHDLLDERGRALLARLSVCADGCTLDTAEVVGAGRGEDGAGDLDVLETLSDLVGHSLVTPTDTGDGEPRFRMLELVRAFAAERLRERGEEEATRVRWAQHLARLGAEAGAGLGGPAARLWRDRLDAETADLRAALRWAVATDRLALVVRLTAPTVRWWWARGLLPAMAGLAEQTAALPSAAALPPDLAARSAGARAALRFALDDAASAAGLLDGVVDDARRRDDAWLLGHALGARAMSLSPADPRVVPLLDEALDQLRRSGDGWSVAFSGMLRVGVALAGGDVTAAERVAGEARELAAAAADDQLAALLGDALALAALLAGDLPRARARLDEAVALHRRTRDLEGAATCLEVLAALALAEGRHAAAARLVGAADAARTTLGVARWSPHQALADRLREALRAALGDDGEARGRAAGAALGPWAALDEELGGPS